MKIYIAASWKHQAAVQMLTDLLRNEGHIVMSFVEDGLKRNFFNQEFESWMKTEDSNEAFYHDSVSAMNCDCFIYLGPSGKDSSAECGMAYCNQIPMIGLWQKGEDFGIMRKMFTKWVVGYDEILGAVYDVNQMILK